MVNSTIPTFQANSPAAPAALAEKPFSGYSPTPALSPYMNLYRRDNNFGTVNNYYSLVRPMLEQRAYNQRLQYEIGSLERATRSQSQAIQQLDQRTNYLYGIPSGGSFMNFQGYYPGLQSSGR
jgi:hypothetical protein